MSKNPNEWFLEDLEVVEKQALIQRYLQSPFSLAWSKLAALLKVSLAPSPPEVIENAANATVQRRQTTATYQSEQYESAPTQEQNLYLSFTDRVDPSLYYTVWHG